MEFYIASRFALKDKVQEAFKKITERGHTISSDWTIKDNSLFN